MVMTNESPDDLRLRIQQELVASGHYQDIYNLLQIELVNSGWFDQFRELTDQTVSNKGEQRFDVLLGELEGKAFEMVPDEVKLKVLKRIKEFLDDVVE